jgi:hypothetical protein
MQFWKRYLLILGLIWASSPAFAAVGVAPANSQQAADQALADTCAKTICRKTSRTLTLRADGGNIARFDTALLPYLDDKGDVILYPGETITLAISKNGNGIAPPTLLKVTDPDGAVNLGILPASDSTLSFELRQNDENPGMRLIVTNVAPVQVKYDAVMFVPTQKGIQPMRTSSCPVLPPQLSAKSFSVFESWPQPITMLVISNIRAMAPGSGVACK